MATPSLSGTAAGVGYGNKRDESDPDLSQDHADTRYGIEHTNAYTGGSSTYPSGTVGGTGSGNKLDAARDSADLSEQHSNTRYNIAAEGAPYVDGDERFKSGTVGGPGIGNKTAGPKTGECYSVRHWPSIQYAAS